jgi:hypothetical protein
VSTELHFAVTIGIDHYPAITNLQLARKDAVAFDAWLASAGVAHSRREAVLLPDGSPPPVERRGAQPRADQIWEAVRDKIVQARAAVKADPACWPLTRLYFFFSGHGIAPTARDAAGLAADCSADDYGNSASMRAMVEYLMESGDFAELVVVADSCRLVPPQAGSAAGQPPWTQRSGTRPDDVKVAELYATRYRSPALESRNLDMERGYFTKALLEGLSGAAGAVEAGQVTTGSLITYARQRVIDLTQGKQRPPQQIGAQDIVLMGGASGVPVVSPAPRTVNITLPAWLTTTARLLDGTLAEVATWVPNGQVWTVRLLPGLYTLESAGTDLTAGLFRIDAGTEPVDVVL